MEEYLIYFEIKAIKISEKDLLADLQKLWDAIHQKEWWAGKSLQEVIMV